MRRSSGFVGLGLALGAGIGAAFGNVAVGVALGLVLAVTVGAAKFRRNAPPQKLG
ncbi:MAG TPA: hypothetical protein VF509_08800 [Sphingobium sp.]